MGVVVREASLPSESAVIVDVLARDLTPLSDERRCEWLYMKGPHGVARAWIAKDEKRGSVIGVAGAFPRLVWMDNKTILAWILGDFCLASAYRSLGPALQLQRSCLSVLEGKEGTLCYDFPSASMVAVYKRLGFSPTGRLLRLARLLRFDRKVREIVRFPLVAHAVSTLGNSVLGAIPRARSSDSSMEISTYHGRCGDEFSILDREHRHRLGISTQRSAQYLNWRYIDNPMTNYEIITARRHGELKGYAVWTQSEEDASVVDLLGENDPAVVKGLLNEIIAIVRNRGVMTLSVWLNYNHPWLSWYTEMGFRVRDSAPIICVPSPSLGNPVEIQAATWFLMQGDRDS
jgi:hypothetical protein